MIKTTNKYENLTVCLSDSDYERRDTKLLFVDDEVELLNLFSAVFIDDHTVVTAESAEAAVEILKKDSEFAVVVADLNMPGADGISFLSDVKTLAPDAVRVMLTGYGTREAAISAVNKADVFKFLTKPIHVGPLRDAVNAALAQHDKLCAERVLLEQTVRGSVGMLVEVLSMAQPRIFGRAAERRQLVTQLCTALHLRERWLVEAAALLCDVGMLSLSDELLDKLMSGEELSRQEEKTIQHQSDVAAELVRGVPRLEPVADAIALQFKNFNGTGYPENRHQAGPDLPEGARILKLVNSYLRLKVKNQSAEEAVETLQRDAAIFDQRMLGALTTIATSNDKNTPVTNTHVHKLREGMVIAQDVYNDQGQLVVRAGHDVTEFLMEHLTSFYVSQQIPGTIAVREAAHGVNNLEEELSFPGRVAVGH